MSLVVTFSFKMLACINGKTKQKSNNKQKSKQHA